MPDEDDAGDRLVQAFREIAQIDSKHDIVEDGLYKGCMVRYTNGTELYHPYIPLMVSGAAALWSGQVSRWLPGLRRHDALAIPVKTLNGVSG
jgi:hypothetical protein